VDRVPVKSAVFCATDVSVYVCFFSVRFTISEHQRSGISNEIDNLHQILFEISKAASDAHDMLKNNSCTPYVYNPQTLLGIKLSERGRKFG
jgi:hypothetical protein